VTLTAATPTITLEERLAVEDLLVREALFLDDGRFDDWLELLTEDIVYRAPVRITRKRGNPEIVEDMFHFDENIHSLRLRVRRLHTDVAWAEDPPSRTRHHVTMAHVSSGEQADELAVRSSVLLYRNRGDAAEHDLLSMERHDVLRRTEMGLLIASRRALLDQATVGTKNLGVFF